MNAGHRETVVFRLAMAAAALSVLDDAYWHREPGTAMSDHLASGLVPVACAALLAAVYPRLRLPFGISVPAGTELAGPADVLNHL